MKKVLSVILAASLITSLFAACGTEKKSGDSHTLCFRDASKSKEAVATFFNSDTGESTEVKFHYNENGGHSVPFWRAIFPEFLEAAMFGHVDVLQK